MAKRENEVSITRAATMLEVHADTVRNWARAAVAGAASKLAAGSARKDLCGRYWIQREEVRRLQILVAEFA